MVSISWKRLISEFDPDLLQDKKLFLCITEINFRNRYQSQRCPIFVFFMTFFISFILSIIIFGLQTSKQSIPTSRNFFFFNFIELKLHNYILLNKYKLFGVKFKNLLFGNWWWFYLFFLLILLLGFLVDLLPRVVLWFLLLVD